MRVRDSLRMPRLLLRTFSLMGPLEPRMSSTLFSIKLSLRRKIPKLEKSNKNYNLIFYQKLMEWGESHWV